MQRLGPKSYYELISIDCMYFIIIEFLLLAERIAPIRKQTRFLPPLKRLLNESTTFS